MKKSLLTIAAAVLALPATMRAQDHQQPPANPPVNPHHTPAGQPATPAVPHHAPAAQPATFTLPASGKLSEAEFLKLLNVRCGQCHAKRIKDMAAIKENKWLEPGNPEKSPIYTVIGKHKKAGGTYHNLSAPEKQAISDFITSLKP
jgi:cytochrome c1